MNVLAIPSWYPSVGNPIYGIFIKEQMLEIAKNHPDLNVGVTYWGQGNNSHLLWGKDHILNIWKYYGFKKLKPSQNKIRHNYIEYSTPALTWTRRLFQGNMAEIIKANINNYKRFEQECGNIDIIHVQAVYPAGIIAMHLSQKFNVPYIITTRMSPFPFQEFLTKQGHLRSLIEEPLRNADHIIAISNSLKSRLETLGYLNVTTINNLVKEYFFTPSEKEVSHPFKFLTIGRLVSQKGFDILLHSMALNKKSQYDLIIVGKGEEKKKLKQLSKSLGIQNRIEWRSELDRSSILGAIREANCLILPSRHETFGNVLTEALACGKPIIATKCGGPEDIVNETNGLLANVNDLKDLAQKMDEMMETYNRYDSRVIRSDFEKRFSSKVITPQIVAIYREVIQQYSKEVSGKSE